MQEHLAQLKDVFPLPLLFLFSPSRVYLECSLILPGILVPVLPHPAGRAGLWHLLLLQDQLSLGSIPGEPGPEGLHQNWAQLWVMLNTTWRRIQHTIRLQTVLECPYRKKKYPQKLSAIYFTLLWIYWSWQFNFLEKQPVSSHSMM